MALAGEAVEAVPVAPAGDPAALEALRTAYARRCAGHDEMLAADGSIRPTWRTFLGGFAAMGPGGWQDAAERTRRLLRDSGIAFNVYADPDDRAHAWRLDLVPALLHEREWATIRDGLVQRARLVDAVLRDLYGEARLLRDGALPAGLVLGSEEFLRPAARRNGDDAPLLLAYACDIARTADGAWRVLADETDIAIGNGYLLASRVALSHGLAELFLGCHTRRLSGHYVAQQQHLQASPRADGRIVVLSAGPSNPSYFSSAYLARYLGFTLVESADLTVRDNAVFLKTLDGLQRVAVILRKIPSRHCDPLQLPGNVPFGVAGLVQAARTGGVRIANALGAGLLHNRALAPFARALCRRLLGEELRLEDAPTLWLGDPTMREQALGRLAQLRIGRINQRSDPGETGPSIEGATLAGERLARFKEQLRHDGHQLIAQEPIALATTPSFDGKGLVPTPFAIRTYVAATESGYHVLPGGLVRLAGAPSTVSLPNGFGSKDLWVVGDAPEPAQPSLLRGHMAEVHLRRTGADLLSRTADNLFWLGRYTERAEGTMRILRSVLARLLDDAGADAEPALLQRLVGIALRKGGPEQAQGSAGWPMATLEQRLAALMYQPDRLYGLRESLDNVHRTATLVRDQISHDAWRTLNALHIDRRWRQPPTRLLPGPALDLLDDGIRFLGAFNGTEAENMTRNFAWRFLEMGRRLERSSHLVDLVGELALGSHEPEGDGSLRVLLELGDSFMTYRSRYVMTPMLAPVIDLLLLDETNPRSLAFQLAEIDHHFAQLPSEGPHRSAEQRLVLRLLTDLRLADIAGLLQRNGGGRLELADLLGRTAAALPELSDIIARAHFAHVETPLVTLALHRQEEPP